MFLTLLGRHVSSTFFLASLRKTPCLFYPRDPVSSAFPKAQVSACLLPSRLLLPASEEAIPLPVRRRPTFVLSACSSRIFSGHRKHAPPGQCCSRESSGVVPLCPQPPGKERVLQGPLTPVRHALLWGANLPMWRSWYCFEVPGWLAPDLPINSVPPCVCEHTSVRPCTGGSQKTIWGSCVSPSTFMWVLRLELRSPSLCCKRFYLLSHLTRR